MLWNVRNAAESRLFLCQTMLIDQVMSTAFSESKRKRMTSEDTNEKSTVLFDNKVNLASFNSIYYSRLALAISLTESLFLWNWTGAIYFSLRTMDIVEYEELRSLPEGIRRLTWVFEYSWLPKMKGSVLEENKRGMGQDNRHSKICLLEWRRIHFLRALIYVNLMIFDWDKIDYYANLMRQIIILASPLSWMLE